MRLSSPTDHFSVHRNTSFLRGCNPIEESKNIDQDSFRGYCTSMESSKHDLKSRQPRIYSEHGSSAAFYPSPARESDFSHSTMTALPAIRNEQEEREMEADNGKRRVKSEHPTADERPFSTLPPSQQRREIPSSSSSSPSSLALRKRIVSWPSGGDEMDFEKRGGDGPIGPNREQREDVHMNSISASGLPSGERLPGIAHLDEQMHTPWSARNAREANSMRGSGGGIDDSLRRLSSHTFPHGNRGFMRESFAGRGEAASLPSISHSPSISGRPFSPTLSSSYDNDRSQHLHSSYHSNATTADRTPASRGESPGSSRRLSPHEMEGGAYRRPSEWTDDSKHQHRYGPPQLPTKSSLFDERRLKVEEGERREVSHRHSTSSLYPDRRAYGSGANVEYQSEFPPLLSREEEGPEPSNTYGRSSHLYDSSAPSAAVGRGEQRRSFGGHSLYDRRSPSYFEEGVGQESGRMDTSSPRHHPYSLAGGPNASPNAPRRRGKLPKVVTDLLKTWLLDHASHPYPTEVEKRRLCNVTGLSISQVSNWFINARRRILVPQGSGNFALGHHPGGVGGSSGPLVHGALGSSPPSPNHHHHLPSHHQQLHHPHQQYQQHLSPLHHPHQQHEDDIHHMYRRGSSHSPPHYPSRHSHSMDETR